MARPQSLRCPSSAGAAVMAGPGWPVPLGRRLRPSGSLQAPARSAAPSGRAGAHWLHDLRGGGQRSGKDGRSARPSAPGRASAGPAPGRRRRAGSAGVRSASGLLRAMRGQQAQARAFGPAPGSRLAARPPRPAKAVAQRHDLRASPAASPAGHAVPAPARPLAEDARQPADDVQPPPARSPRAQQPLDPAAPPPERQISPALSALSASQLSPAAAASSRSGRACTDEESRHRER
jgi:hypothetical protein